MLYPIGIQDFESIRRDGYVYVDKTDIIFKLSHGSGKFIFLSRPRRFGKSLLVSTMEAYFSGRKELFDGVAVAGLEKDWARYPVLRFDLTGKSYTAADDLQDQIDEKGYVWPFLADDRKVFKIGANFTTKNHRLENWKLAD